MLLVNLGLESHVNFHGTSHRVKMLKNNIAEEGVFFFIGIARASLGRKSPSVTRFTTLNYFTIDGTTPLQANGFSYTKHNYPKSQTA